MRIRNIHAGYWPGDRFHLVLKNISWDLAPGVCYGILGVSGSGKTTLLNVLNGEVYPISGTRELAGIKKRDIKKLNQDFEASEIPHLTGDAYSQILEKKQREEFKVFAEEFKIKDILANTLRSYSGGELQRFYVALILSTKPKLLLLDEPTSQVNVEQAIKLTGQIVRFCKENGITGIISTHQPAVAKLLDEVLVLHNGYPSHYGKYYDAMLYKSKKREYYTNLIHRASPTVTLPENILDMVEESTPVKISVEGRLIKLDLEDKK